MVKFFLDTSITLTLNYWLFFPKFSIIPLQGAVHTCFLLYPHFPLPTMPSLRPLTQSCTPTTIFSYTYFANSTCHNAEVLQVLLTLKTRKIYTACFKYFFVQLSKLLPDFLESADTNPRRNVSYAHLALALLQ